MIIRISGVSSIASTFRIDFPKEFAPVEEESNALEGVPASVAME
jgi:hypothetical protein